MVEGCNHEIAVEVSPGYFKCEGCGTCESYEWFAGARRESELEKYRQNAKEKDWQEIIKEKDALLEATSKRMREFEMKYDKARREIEDLKDVLQTTKRELAIANDRLTELELTVALAVKVLPSSILQTALNMHRISK